ncbi:hypothetical protein DYB30_002453 [Aphanomyces astaci]|uniref:Uncharacterized protein n=1 Tax=Aphanomyces astaci TaxID=112090 RepID=A0A397D3U8_APHAT|nr:hypothetical protein DYB38_004008 [Aphanomyces astaci]RHY64418.1 hypothetical protein DYB30_002453 [Aphanomyces astaci]RHY70232.1 hypothetical protein DYB34_002189 [Aphanomyces astaci]
MVLSVRNLFVGGAAAFAAMNHASRCGEETLSLLQRYGGACQARNIPLSTRWCSVTPCRDLLARVTKRGCRNSRFMRVLARCEGSAAVNEEDDLDGDGESDFASVRREAQNAGKYDKNALTKEALDKKILAQFKKKAKAKAGLARKKLKKAAKALMPVMAPPPLPPPPVDSYYSDQDYADDLDDSYSNGDDIGDDDEFDQYDFGNYDQWDVGDDIGDDNGVEYDVINDHRDIQNGGARDTNALTDDAALANKIKRDFDQRIRSIVDKENRAIVIAFRGSADDVHADMDDDDDDDDDDDA